MGPENHIHIILIRKVKEISKDLKKKAIRYLGTSIFFLFWLAVYIVGFSCFHSIYTWRHKLRELVSWIFGRSTYIDIERMPQDIAPKIFESGVSSAFFRRIFTRNRHNHSLIKPNICAKFERNRSFEPFHLLPGPLVETLKSSIFNTTILHFINVK